MPEKITYRADGWVAELVRHDSPEFGENTVAATVTSPDGDRFHTGRTNVEYSAAGARDELKAVRELLPLLLARAARN